MKPDTFELAKHDQEVRMYLAKKKWIEYLETLITDGDFLDKATDYVARNMKLNEDEIEVLNDIQWEVVENE